MKSSLFLIMFLACSGLGAHAATLKYFYDFNQLDGSLASLNNNNLAGPDAGSATFSGGGWINYTDGYEGLGYDSRTDGGQLILGSASNGLGLNTTEGFSLSMNIKDFSPGNGQSSALYANLLTLTPASGQNLYLQKDSGDTSSAGQWTTYCKTGGTGGHVGNWGYFTPAKASFSNIILTFRNGNLHVYQDGNLKITASGVNFTGDVQSLRLASGNTTMDDLQLYAGVLNDSEIAALAANPALPVPEPATATLSLLGLASLCMRRRRA